MRRDQAARERRRQAGGEERGGAGDHAVDQHGHAARTRPERHAGEHADLESAHRGQHADRVGRVGAVQLEPRRTTSTFRRSCVAVDAGAAAADLSQAPRRAARRVTAAAGVVLAMPMSPSASGDASSSAASPMPASSAASATSRGMAGLRREVGRARAEPQVTDTGLVERLDDACVDDHELGARLPREHAHGGAARGERREHLPQ